MRKKAFECDVLLADSVSYGRVEFCDETPLIAADVFLPEFGDEGRDVLLLSIRKDLGIPRCSRQSLSELFETEACRAKLTTKSHEGIQRPQGPVLRHHCLHRLTGSDLVIVGGGDRSGCLGLDLMTESRKVLKHVSSVRLCEEVEDQIGGERSKISHEAILG